MYSLQCGKSPMALEPAVRAVSVAVLQSGGFALQTSRLPEHSWGPQSSPLKEAARS